MFNKRATHKKWRLQRSPETFNITALTNCTTFSMMLVTSRKLTILPVCRKLWYASYSHWDKVGTTRQMTLQTMSRERSISNTSQSLWTWKHAQWPIRCLETLKDNPKVGRRDSKRSNNRGGANLATSRNYGHLPGVNNKQPGSSNGLTMTNKATCQAFFLWWSSRLSLLQRLQEASHGVETSVRSFKGSCFNCLLPGHFVRVPQVKFLWCFWMSIQALHTSPPTKTCTRSWGGITWWEYQWAWDGNAASNAQSSFISAAKSVTTLPIVPVRVKAKGSNGSSLTYTFLDAPIPHSVPTSLWTIWASNRTRRDFPLIPSASRIV